MAQCGDHSSLSHLKGPLSPAEKHFTKLHGRTNQHPAEEQRTKGSPLFSHGHSLEHDSEIREMTDRRMREELSGLGQSGDAEPLILSSQA